jgi:hypothetical protein
MRDGAPVQVETSPESLWTYVASPTLVVDQTGVIRALSASVQDLLPAAAPGGQLEAAVDWLSPVHLQLVAPSSVPDSKKSFQPPAPSAGASSKPTTPRCPARKWHGRSWRTPVTCFARPTAVAPRPGSVGPGEFGRIRRPLTF